MRRPVGVTIIGVIFLAAAVYFWIGSATVFVDPGEFPFTEATLRQALRLSGPYPAMAVGICYGVVGWGLFRLKNWARLLAVLVMTIGCAFMVPRLFVAGIGHRRFAVWIGLQIALRAVGVFYLMGSEIIDIFVRA